MIINWCTYYTKPGMRELFCAELQNSNILGRAKEYALWYDPFLPVDGSDRVIVYQAWEDASQLEKHKNAGYMAKFNEIKDYYCEKSANEGCEIDALVPVGLDTGSDNSDIIASWCTYYCKPGTAQEYARKVVESGVYEKCQKDTSVFEFLIPWGDSSRVIIREIWDNNEKLAAHCRSNHVSVSLKEIKTDYVMAVDNYGCQPGRLTSFVNE